MKKTISLTLVLALCVVAKVTKADFTFGEPVNLGPIVNSSWAENGPTISVDGLELYFAFIPPTLSPSNLWVATRPTQQDDWGEPVILGPEINSSSEEALPKISPDGLELYFYSKRPSGYGGCDIWMAQRPTLSDPWGPAINLGPPVNTSQHELGASITADGLELFFSRTSSSAGGLDIWVTTRATRDEPWGTPSSLGSPVNSSASETAPCISADGLVLLFSSHPDGPYPPGGYGGTDIWITQRRTRNDPWEPPWNPGPPLNTPYCDNCPSIAGDGRLLYFSDWHRGITLGQSPRPGGFGARDLWKAPILPIVDLNGDRIVDAEDMCILVDHWGTDNSLCDIGPMPWGDGVVDVQDLIVLAEHLFEGLVAYWKLDETEGMVVTDSVGDNEGYALGNPIWQPESGIVNGALQLDGVDDCVVTGSAPIPEPEKGSYSIIAWIKGGAPSQVVLSQMGKANWLCTDPSGGTLMTELTIAGQGGRSLGSEAVITDGNWHRIGFVWDGSYRRLYVDGVVVAEDLQDNLDISSNGLYFGTGKTMERGTFWAGLIDDVRIYNRAVNP